ncbi:MAG: hypothetical protein R2690_13295 [Acidimicrobiales bacterium]
MLGAGTLGLLTIAALRRYAPDAALLIVAKHPHQRALAAELLGDAGRAAGGTIVEPGELKRAVRRTTGAMAVGDGAIVRLAGGADIVVDCVGSAASLTDSLAVVRPRVGSWSSACPASRPSTSRRCGTRRPGWWVPTPTAPRSCPRRTITAPASTAARSTSPSTWWLRPTSVVW